MIRLSWVLMLLGGLLIPCGDALAQQEDALPSDLRLDPVWGRPLTYADHLMLMIKRELNSDLASFSDGSENGLFLSREQAVGPAYLRIEPDSGLLMVRLDFFAQRLTKSRATVCTFMLSAIDQVLGATMDRLARDNVLSYLYPPSGGQLSISERTAANSRLLASSRAIVIVIDENAGEEFSCMRPVGGREVQVKRRKL